MRVLGVDPGLTRCGLGVVERRGGHDVHLVHVAVLRTSPETPLAERLLQVARGIDEAIAAHAPDAVAVEQVFAQHNIASVMATAQVAGLAMVAGARGGLSVALHTPSEVKAAVTGSGRAGKEQVGAMVRRILRLESPPRPADAADALALAVCHLWRGVAAGAGARQVGAGGAHDGETPAQRAWARAEATARRGPTPAAGR